MRLPPRKFRQAIYGATFLGIFLCTAYGPDMGFAGFLIGAVAITALWWDRDWSRKKWYDSPF